MQVVQAFYLHEYYFRFFGSPGHELGLYSYVSALDEEQASGFAAAIANKLAGLWGIETVEFQRHHARIPID